MVLSTAGTLTRLITIQLDLDRIEALAIVGPVNVTLPKAGYLPSKRYLLPGAQLAHLRNWVEHREAKVNPNQFSMDGFGGKDNGET